MKLKDVYRYTGTLYAVNLLASGLTFLVMIWLSRQISKEALGAYGLFQAYFMLGAYVTGLGVNQTTVKYIAERKIPLTEIHSLLATVLTAMVAAFVGGGLLLIHFGYELAGLAAIMLPAYHLFDFSLSYARGHLWKRAESGILLASSLGTSAFTLLLVPIFPDYHGPIFGQIVSSYCVALTLLAIFFYKQSRPCFTPVRNGWVKGFAVIAAPVFVTASLYSFSEVVDRFIVEHFLGLSVLAEYFIAMSFFNILDKPSGLLSRVLLSYFSSGSKDDAATQLQSVQRLIRFNTLVFPVFSLAVITVLPPVLSHFLNKDYGNAFNILAIVSTVMVIKAFEVVNSMLAVARNRPSTNMYSHVFSLTVYIPLAIVLLKLFGIYGIALSIVLRWIVFSVYQFLHMRNSAIGTTSLSIFARAVAAYAAALALFPIAPWAMVLVYLAMGAVFRLWTPRELIDAPLRFARG